MVAADLQLHRSVPAFCYRERRSELRLRSPRWQSGCLVMHWVDLWWVTMPSMHVAAEAGHAALTSGGGELLASLQSCRALGSCSRSHKRYGAYTSWSRTSRWLRCPFGSGSLDLFVGTTMLRLGRHALTPYGDPYFADSLRFENV